MILLLYLSIALIGIGLAGVIASRNIILTIFSIEIIFLASIVFLAYGITYNQSAYGSEIILAIWAVAALDAMVLVVIYLILGSIGSKFNIKEFLEFKG
jgi:NADH-ubiquinone/plastoquinone oxidoreductase chain 4L.